LNRPVIFFKKIESVLKNHLKKKSPGNDEFIEKCYSTFKEKIKPILHNCFHKTKEEKGGGSCHFVRL
jgi:hypothetical protein